MQMTRFCHLRVENLSQTMQIMDPELEEISLRLYRNQLTLNVLKTQYMVFHKPRTFPPSTLDSLFIGGSEIERVLEFRCLGVNLDPCLKFKLSKFVPIICEIRYVLNERCLKMLYYSVIYPTIIYCASAWSGTFKSFFKLVFIVEKGVNRAMCGANRRTPSQGLFEELGLLKLCEVLNV